MRTVFNNAELAHVWASRSQATGRGSHMFFEDDSIYSYGYHYKIAKFHGNVVLVNASGYSPSTGRHTRIVRSAISHLVSFEVPNINTPKAPENVTFLGNDVANQVTNLIRSIRVSEDAYEIERIKASAKYFNDFCAAFGIKDRIELDVEFLSDMRALHLSKLKAQIARERHYEANKTEIDAKRDAERARREAAKAAEFDAKVQAAREAWLQGESNSAHFIRETLLRIQDNAVQTSRGASVPLPEARALYAAIIAGENVVGRTIGRYTVDSVTKDTVEIGCHTIPLAEASRILGGK